jgi:hypothetical protein
MLPKNYTPISILHRQNEAIKITLDRLNNENISYPLIVKPDIGFRGLLVKKIEEEKDLIAYIKKYPIDIIIQEFLPHEFECGIFYYRHPEEDAGHISSITLKEFLSIKGDGKLSIRELVKSNSRTCLYYPLIKDDPLIKWDVILKKNQIMRLSAIGNHSKGTKFINGNHLITKELEKSLDTLNHQVDGWFYGRLDVKYHSLEDLYQGKFKVLELNGILAEPTHIYDSAHSSYWQALKTIRTHWKQLYKIARYNHDCQKVAYRKTFPFIREMLALKSYSNRLKKLSQQ